MQRLAIFGGTFNPIHWGHLLMAETALCQFELDQVIWVPTYHPSYKAASQLVDFQHRLVMVQQSVISHPQFAVSAIEQSQSGDSYAINTFLALQQLHPNSQWFWLIGLDAFRSLPHWHRHQELAPQCEWLVVPRWGSTADANSLQSAQYQSAQCQSSQFLCQQVAEKLAAKSIVLKWHLLNMPLVDISSSLIRQYCHQQRSIRYLVTDATRDYINQHKLYSEKDQY